MSYPVLLNLTGRRVLIIGGGQVAARKADSLLQAGAGVSVLSPAFSAEMPAAVNRITEAYVAGMVAALRPFLVIAATDDGVVNQAVIAEAREAGVLVGTADDNEQGDFSSMAVMRQGPVTVAVATGGASPALAQHLRGRLAACVGPEYGVLAGWLAALRPRIVERVPSQAARAAFWRRVIDSPVLDQLRAGDTDAARRTLDQLSEAAE